MEEGQWPLGVGGRGSGAKGMGGRRRDSNKAKGDGVEDEGDTGMLPPIREGGGANTPVFRGQGGFFFVVFLF